MQVLSEVWLLDCLPQGALAPTIGARTHFSAKTDGVHIELDGQFVTLAFNGRHVGIPLARVQRWEV